MKVRNLKIQFLGHKLVVALKDDNLTVKGKSSNNSPKSKKLNLITL